MEHTESTLEIGRTLKLSFDEVLTRVERALEQEGFGILTRIDVQATMKQKLDVEMPRFLILGACNPRLAHRAITADPRIGLLLPCNVVLRDAGAAGTRVEAVNPMVLMEKSSAPELAGVAGEATQRLRRAIDSLA